MDQYEYSKAYDYFKQAFEADASLLQGARLPNTEQSRVLLRHGLGQTFWNSLTITGKIEARGRFLSELPVPDLQAAIVEDISEMAIGHLGKGLLLAHGMGEEEANDRVLARMGIAADEIAEHGFAAVEAITLREAETCPPSSWNLSAASRVDAQAPSSPTKASWAAGSG